MTRSLALLVLVAALGVTPACGTDQGGGADAALDASETAWTPDILDAELPADGLGLLDVAGDKAEPLCGSCHGSPGQPAPPPGLDGSTDIGAPGVGAHAAHLGAADMASTWRAPVRCKHCHLVPGGVADEGHVDEERPADLRFSGLASYDLTTSYDAAVQSCAVYCHGAAWRVGAHDSPSWTSFEATTCTSCHGWPPAEPHPQADDCGRCHVEVADAAGAILRPEFHIDTILQAPHGAHFAHLGGGLESGHLAADMACQDCHDGTRYHGALKDGGDLHSTMLCLACHDESLDRDQWIEPLW